MKKIKVLQFPIANSRGGMTQYAMRNWEYIDHNKFQFEYATMSKKLDFEDEIVAHGCRVHYISCYAEENREQFIKEVNQILDNGYDVIHLHTKQWKSFQMEELSIAHKIPKIIVHSHNTSVDTVDEIRRAEEISKHYEIRELFNKKLATDFWACSNKAAEWLFGNQIPKEDIRIMKNAIDLDKFSYNEEVRKDYRNKMNLDGQFVIGHVGRFAYQKNHEFMIRVFQKISQYISCSRLILVGGGQLEDSVKKLVCQLGIEDKVIFMGNRKDINCLYQVMDVFCMPSRFEGLPISMIEAQAAGLPCLASNSITEEAAITKNARLLSLCEDDWVRAILDLSYGYIRKSNEYELTCSGYNIKKQIKNIEELYEN